MSEPRRVVFDIMRFSIRDGPGIRTTVFFKGCPLDCWWCHNPESRAPELETIRRDARCIRCGACREACPTGAASGKGVCTLCGACVAACPTGAREIVGRAMTVAEILAEVLKDRAFFEESGGGVTFSGGEPLADPPFLATALDACRAEGLHTAVDTCGHAPTPVVRGIGGRTDLFLYDLKLMDDARHREYTGVSNALVLRNLAALAEDSRNVAIRFPVIPGVNDDEENVMATGRFLADLGFAKIHLLPYHGTASEKYRQLGKPYRLASLRPPSAERLAAMCRTLESFGLNVQVGG
jgi:pyruvate formate lyase activating enzyme